jgi:predicted permease
MNLLASILLTDILPIFVLAGVGFLLARFAKVDVKMLANVVFY